MPLPTQLMSIIFFFLREFIMFQIHSGEKAALRLRRSLGRWATSCIEARSAHFQELFERSTCSKSNWGRTHTNLQSGTNVLEHFYVSGSFSNSHGSSLFPPPPPLPLQTMLDACIQIFFRVSTLYRLVERRTARKFRKGCTVLRGNREMTEKYEYCSTVQRTFVRDCRYFCNRISCLPESAFRPHETSEFTHRNRIFLKPLSRLVWGSVHMIPGNKISDFNLKDRELQILRRGRLLVKNFSVLSSARAPTSFWREKVVAVVILLRVLARMS